jgi:REP element-mobilizing transposase RayT
MILAYHSIFSMYGFWLPNDPRGSGSDYIASWELFRYGRAMKVTSRRSVAGLPHDRAARLAAKQVLRYPPVTITGEQAVAVVAGFRRACEEAGYRIHACAVLPEHVHLVVGVHARDIRTIIGHMKSRATRALKERVMGKRQPAVVGRPWLERMVGGRGVSTAGELVCRTESAQRGQASAAVVDCDSVRF